MSKIDELRELVEAAGRLVGELAGIKLVTGEVDEVRRLAADLGDYAGMIDDVAVCAEGVVASVVWSDGVVSEWAIGDVLLGWGTGTIEAAERVAASHGVPLEVL